MVRLNFRESPPTRSQHIRGDARSRHAGVHPVLVPGGLIEGNYSLRGQKWKFVLGHLHSPQRASAPFNFQSSKIPIVPSGGGFCTVSAFLTINRLALPGHAAFC